MGGGSVRRVSAATTGNEEEQEGGVSAHSTFLAPQSAAGVWPTPRDQPPVSVVVGVGVPKIRKLRVARAIVSARLQGMRASWLPCAPWLPPGF